MSDNEEIGLVTGIAIGLSVGGAARAMIAAASAIAGPIVIFLGVLIFVRCYWPFRDLSP